MSDVDQEQEDKVLRRMLKTPPKPHKPKEGGAMNISADTDLIGVAEFMQSRMTADRLLPIAHALAMLAPALWGHLPAGKVRALWLEGVKPRQEASTQSVP